MKFDFDEATIDWLVSMCKIWFCSFLLYQGFINNEVIAWWILGTLCFIEYKDKFMSWEGKNDSDN